ncbi:MAG: flagellar basal body L-ring protein FlgH [Rhodospirillaceae bacterium]
MTALSTPRRIGRFALLGALALTLPACNTFERLSDMGSSPSLSKIEDPQAKPGYQPVSLPMPTPMTATRNPNSLWRAGARAFLRDQRAAQVGDLLTVFITIKDKADFISYSNRARGGGTPNSERMNAGVTGVNGLGALSKLLGTVGSLPTVDVNSASKLANNGNTGRNDNITMQLAAVVIQTLPNGNLVIQGKQQVRVNAEMRELTITGIVRPEDIDSSNQISYEKIAEARISYGGKGFASDVQGARYGQELLDILLPF